MNKGIATSRDAKGELVIKLTPAFKQKIIEALREKLGKPITDEDVLDYVVNETRTIKNITEKK